jgi:DNA repair ATPase RecN
MKTTAIVLALICGAVAAAGAAISQVPIMLLGLLGALATMVWFGMSSAKQRRLSDDYDQLPPDQKILIRPIYKLHQELQATAQRATDATAKVIAEEAVVESQTILTHSLKLVEARVQMRKGLHSRSGAASDLAELRGKLESATDEGERQAFQAAIEAREKESSYYGSMDAGIEKIDATLRQAEASLAEIKARLALAASAPEGDTSAHTELEETLTRLRSLSVSFDEAEELLKGKTG